MFSDSIKVDEVPECLKKKIERKENLKLKLAAFKEKRNLV